VRGLTCLPERGGLRPGILYPKNLGRMSDPDAVGIVHGWCGDTM
jgi:hypothetical protein